MPASSRPVRGGRGKPSFGRDRVRWPADPRRAPMAAAIPRPEKARAGRTAPAMVPAHVRSEGADFEALDGACPRRKPGMKPGKLANVIERVSARLRDVNGPRGGVGKVCRVNVVPSGLPSLLIERRHASLQAAMDGALRRGGRAVRRSVQRRRTVGR